MKSKRLVILLTLLVIGITVAKAVTERDVKAVVTEYYSALNMFASAPNSRPDGILKMFTRENSVYNDVYCAEQNDYNENSKSSISEYLGHVGGYYNTYRGYLSFNYTVLEISQRGQSQWKVLVDKRLSGSGSKRINYSFKEEVLVVSMNGECKIAGTKFVSANPKKEKEKADVSAKIENVRVIHNQVVRGELGMEIKMRLNVKGLKGKRVRVSALFCDDKGVNLKDENGKFKTQKGYVCTFEDVVPTYDNSEWRDFKVSIPYNELHLKEKTEKIRLYFNAKDRSESPSQVIYVSPWYAITFDFSSVPTAVIKDVKVKHNQFVNWQRCMTISMYLNVKKFKDKRGEVAAYFFDVNGDGLKDENEKYWTRDGFVATSVAFSPKYDNSEWRKFEISIPYSELHLSWGFDSRIVRFCLIVWNDSNSPYCFMFRSPYYRTSF